MQYCRDNSIEDRIARRNPSDFRLSTSPYVEVHHIVPRSLGGNNDASNLVVLLPEEHLIAHKMRYKAYNCRQDMLAVRMMLNGFKYNSRYKSPGLCTIRITKSTRLGYAWLRSNSADFRKKHGWHTSDGRKRISDARKNMTPVKDVVTGISIGMVPVDHPNTLSGLWVHTSKGRKATDIERARHSQSRMGSSNSNANSATDEDILKALKCHIDEGKFTSIRSFIRYMREDLEYPNINGSFRFKDYHHMGSTIKLAYAFCDRYPGYDIDIFKNKKGNKAKWH